MNDDLMMHQGADTAWPDYAPDEILPGLWQGGTEDHEVVGCHPPAAHYASIQPFDLVVTLYADALPAPWGVEEARYGFPDSSLSPSSIERVVALARHAHARWRQGARVLVRCQAGVNRSGLVMALVLMHEGLTAAEAIRLIRLRRSPVALSNRAFERWLLEDAHMSVRPPSSDERTAA